MWLVFVASVSDNFAINFGVQAWARHRAQCHNKKIPTKIDDTMKSNFRSILSKCPDIELVADRCDFQTGNHKIYKFLTTPDFTGN